MNFSQLLQPRNKLHSPKHLAQKGRKQKFLTLYASVLRRNSHRKNPAPAKCKSQKMIHKVANNLVEFRVMSSENRERTIYNWVLKLLRLLAGVVRLPLRVSSLLGSSPSLIPAYHYHDFRGRCAHSHKRKGFLCHQYQHNPTN